jgi:hypothetical protein
VLSARSKRVSGWLLPRRDRESHHTYLHRGEKEQSGRGVAVPPVRCRVPAPMRRAVVSPLGRATAGNARPRARSIEAVCQAPASSRALHSGLEMPDAPVARDLHGPCHIGTPRGSATAVAAYCHRASRARQEVGEGAPRAVDRLVAAASHVGLGRERVSERAGGEVRACPVLARRGGGSARRGGVWAAPWRCFGSSRLPVGMRQENEQRVGGRAAAFRGVGVRRPGPARHSVVETRRWAWPRVPAPAWARREPATRTIASSTVGTTSTPRTAIADGTSFCVLAAG